MKMKQRLVNLLKRGYSSYVKAISSKAAKQPMKQQVVYLVSFPHNNEGLLEALNQDVPLVVYATNPTVLDEAWLRTQHIEVSYLSTFSGLRQAIRDVTRSKMTLCDNYMAFLGDITKTSDRHIYQLWHATGAIKCFGLEDKLAQQRSKQDIARFNRVYRAFDYYIVASKQMADVFIRSYGAKEEQMRYLGFPRTDQLFTDEINKVTDKKLIVYLPTYREGQTDLPPLDVSLMEESLAEDYHLVIKLHPHIKDLVSNQVNTAFVTWHTEMTTEECLQQADVLITDYSSVAFDYALIQPDGTLLFYWYDEAEYDITTGIQVNMKESVTSAICYTTQALLSVITGNQSSDVLKQFNDEWNTYNDGHVITRVTEYIKEQLGD